MSSGTYVSLRSPQRYRSIAIIALASLLAPGCSPGPTPLAQFIAGPAERFHRVEIDGALAGRMHEQRLVAESGALKITITMVVDLPGAGRLSRHDDRRFAAQAPHMLTHSSIRIEHPDGSVSERDRMGGEQEPENLAEQLAQNGDMPEVYRVGESLLLRRTDSLPELP